MKILYKQSYVASLCTKVKIQKEDYSFRIDLLYIAL